MDFFNESSIMEKLPLLVIIVFLIIVVALLMMDRNNLTEISERQNSIKDKIDSIDVDDVNKRYLVTNKLSEDELKNKWSKLSGFVSESTINKDVLSENEKKKG